MDGSGVGMGELAAAALIGRFAEAMPVRALELRLQALAANACVLQLERGGLFRARGFPLRSPDGRHSSAIQCSLPSGHVRLGALLACSSSFGRSCVHVHPSLGDESDHRQET